MPDVPITIVRSLRRTISLHITPNASILVKAPRFVSDREIQKFISQHTEWIEKHTEKIKQKKTNKQTDEYFYLGKHVSFAPGNYTEISVTDDKLFFPQALLFRKEKELTDWYIKQARKIITEQTVFYAEQMQTTYKEISFSDTKSQWGRCTHDNRLQFSWRLVMAPLLVINYVVVHELSHTIEKNHSRGFWSLVRRFNPSYRQQIKWLSDNGSSLKDEY
jgi:predicted metal-dependent hydrolase